MKPTVKKGTDKNVSNAFPIQNGKKEDVLSYYLSTLLYNIPLGRSKKTEGTEINLF
jgi:hypothetical protein